MVGKNEKLSGSDNNATNNGLKVGLVGETGATNSPYTIAYEHARGSGCVLHTRAMAAMR